MRHAVEEYGSERARVTLAMKGLELYMDRVRHALLDRGLPADIVDPHLVEMKLLVGEKPESFDEVQARLRTTRTELDDASIDGAVESLGKTPGVPETLFPEEEPTTRNRMPTLGFGNELPPPLVLNATNSASQKTTEELDWEVDSLIASSMPAPSEQRLSAEAIAAMVTEELARPEMSSIPDLDLDELGGTLIEDAPAPPRQPPVVCPPPTGSIQQDPQSEGTTTQTMTAIRLPPVTKP